MTVMVVTVSWVVRRLAAALPSGLRPDGTPFGVWFAALPVWVALLVGALLYAPAASYLVSLPLLAAVLLVTPALVFARTAARSLAPSEVEGETAPYSGMRTWPARIASAAVALLVWVLWAPDLVTLLPFAVTLLGRMPVVTPTWAYPAVFFLAGILLWPPVLGVLVGRVRWRVAHGVAAGVLMLALVVTGLLAWMAPAFTTERPQQRSALFLDDRVRRTAHWELHGNEPGVDVGASAPANVAWQIAERPSVPGAGINPKAHLFRGVVSSPATPAPATITATVVRGEGSADIEITVTPGDAEWRTVAIVLPESIVPTKTTLVGRTRGGRWQAWHSTVPRDGLTWRATVPASQVDRLAGTEVWISRATLPDAEPGSRVPAWLHAPHTAWMTRHVVMLPIAINEVLQTPAPVPSASLPVPSAAPAVVAPLPPAVTPGGAVPR